MADCILPPPRRYTPLDVYPLFIDPRCTPQFPLASYWPVYLGNFKCEGPTEQQPISVQEYFASKGLLSRMVFARDKRHDEYRVVQCTNKVFDFLVYFVRPQDAQDAITYCHRDAYKGHRLNVFSGRDPAYLDRTRSAKFTLVQRANCSTEQIIENTFDCQSQVRISCIIKHSPRDFFVEYQTTHDRTCGVKMNKLAVPQQVKPGTVKQRFMEQEVEQEIRRRVAEDPHFMDMCPSSFILEALYQGRIPQFVDQSSANESLVIGKLRKLKGRKKYRKWVLKNTARNAQFGFGIECDFVQKLRIPDDVLVNRAIKKMAKHATKANLVWQDYFPNAYEEYLEAIRGTSVGSNWPQYRNGWMSWTDPFQQQMQDAYNTGLNYIMSAIRKQRF